MKESPDNLSWADIGKSLNRCKNDLKARWRTIKEQNPRGTATETDEETNTASGAKYAGRTKSETETPKKTKAKTNSKHSTQKVARENKATKLRASTTRPQEDILSGDEASSESTRGAKERKRQKEYLFGHIYKPLYPEDVKFEPNQYLTQFLTKWDRELLETIDSMNNHSRLLETQANFINATGKAVPLAVIKDWFQGRLIAEGDCHPTAVLESSAERVEKWIAVSIEEQDE